MTAPSEDAKSAPLTSTRAALLAISLLSLELLAGMQAFLLNTVIPVVGADLDARDFYGVIVGTAQVAMFVTMPLGPWLLERFSVNRLLLTLTWVTVAGAVTSALAPNIGVFLLGRVSAGLGAGALATVSLAAIVSVLSPGWRRGVLAGYNVTWVVASLIGPLYAGWVTSALSWRWALVLYLPVLIVARVVAARQLQGTMQSTSKTERLNLGSAILLACGVALLAIVGLTAVPIWIAFAAGIAGVTMALLAARALLPAGSLILRRGRPAALGTMGLLTGAYFGAQAIMSIVVYDVFDASAGEVAFVLAGSGFGWALAGLCVSRWPARTARAYVIRSGIGAALIAVGCLLVASIVLDFGQGFEVILAFSGWGIAGVGIGMVYLDTLNHIVEVPPEMDGVSVPRAAAAAILVEAIATAVTATLASAVVGRAITLGAGQQSTIVVLAMMAAIAVSVIWSSRRVTMGDPTDD